jgi:hypothetical protein
LKTNLHHPLYPNIYIGFIKAAKYIIYIMYIIGRNRVISFYLINAVSEFYHLIYYFFLNTHAPFRTAKYLILLLYIYMSTILKDTYLFYKI